MKGGPKPLVSCTSRAVPNMEIYTDSPLVKKAREGVLEFLLVNHPLDCPICDQGGECDLQDQSVKFGSDSSRRLLSFKRPVQDKDMGVFIKTIMTRCIHCTRCIRFLKDKVLMSSLGTVGRGEKTEVSFYFKKFLDKSLLSGNIVDVCPVGALTNKDYSFRGRPWEIYEIKCSGVSDTLGLSMRLGIKRGFDEIFRITPVFSKETGTKLISDFSRHCVGGVLLDRIEDCGFGFKRELGVVPSVDQKTFSSVLLFNRVSACLDCFTLFSKSSVSVIGSYTSVKDLFFLLLKTSETGSNQSYHESFLRNSISSLYPFLYSSGLLVGGFITLKVKSFKEVFYGKKNASLKDLSNRYFIVGTDFTSEFAPIVSKMMVSFPGYIQSRNAFVFGLLPYKIENFFFNFKLGLSSSCLIDILEGRSTLCKNVCKITNVFVFFSMALKRRFDGEFLHSFSNKISFIKNSNGVLSSTSSETSSCDLFIGKNSILKKLSSFNNNNRLFFLNNPVELFKSYESFRGLNLFSNFKHNILVLIGEVSEKVVFVSKKSSIYMCIYLSSFNSRNTKFKGDSFNKNVFGKMLLPKRFFLEDSFSFISTLGCYKKNSGSFLGRGFLKRFLKGSQYDLNFLLRLNKPVLRGSNLFVLHSNIDDKKSGLKSFPIYLSKGYVYLTEIKSISKENFFQEDTFLKKSPQLIKLVSFFRLHHCNFSS
jgi:hypothetical protein